MRTLMLAALLAPSLALAVPLSFSHQGRLLDSTGVALSGTKPVTFALYDAPSGGTEVWSETQSVSFEGGYYGITLGESSPLKSSDFTGEALYLGIAVDGAAELSPRLPVLSVPHALHSGTASEATTALTAETATSLSGGPVDATEIRINGTTVLTSDGALQASVSWSDLQGVPDSLGSDTLAELSCTTDQIARYNGTAWVCASDGTEAISASAITGTLDPSALPSLSASDVGALPDTTTAADIGGVAAGAAITLGDSSATCDTNSAGTLRWTGDTLDLCDGARWTVLRAVQSGTESAPATSCKQLKADNPGIDSGAYFIDPNGGDPSDAKETWCEMDLRGGGWTRLAAVTGNLHICSYTVAKGTEAQVISGAADAWFGASWGDAVMQDNEILAVLSSGEAYAFTSSDGSFNWSNVASGTIGVETHSGYNVRGAWNNDDYATLPNQGGCNNNQGCLLGGYNGSRWSVILGIGAYDVGAFNQNNVCEPSGSGHRGLYSGGTSDKWSSSGFVYVR